MGALKRLIILGTGIVLALFIFRGYLFFFQQRGPINRTGQQLPAESNTTHSGNQDEWRVLTRQSHQEELLFNQSVTYLDNQDPGNYLGPGAFRVATFCAENRGQAEDLYREYLGRNYTLRRKKPAQFTGTDQEWVRSEGTRISIEEFVSFAETDRYYQVVSGKKEYQELVRIHRCQYFEPVPDDGSGRVGFLKGKQTDAEVMNFFEYLKYIWPLFRGGEVLEAKTRSQNNLVEYTLSEKMFALGDWGLPNQTRFYDVRFEYNRTTGAVAVALENEKVLEEQ